MILSPFEKKLVDEFIALKEKMNGGKSEDNSFIFSPFRMPDKNPEYSPLRNFDRDLARLLNIKFSFNSTSFRKRLCIVLFSSFVSFRVESTSFEGFLF